MTLVKIEIDIHSQKIEIVCAIFELSLETFIRSPKWMSMESRFESPQIAEKTLSYIAENFTGMGIVSLRGNS